MSTILCGSICSRHTWSLVLSVVGRSDAIRPRVGPRCQILSHRQILSHVICARWGGGAVARSFVL